MFGSLVKSAVGAVGSLLGGDEEKKAPKVVQQPQRPDYSGLMQPKGLPDMTDRANASKNKETEKAKTADPMMMLGAHGNDPMLMARQWLEALREEEDDG